MCASRGTGRTEGLKLNRPVEETKGGRTSPGMKASDDACRHHKPRPAFVLQSTEVCPLPSLQKYVPCLVPSIASKAQPRHPLPSTSPSLTRSPLGPIPSQSARSCALDRAVDSPTNRTWLPVWLEMYLVTWEGEVHRLMDNAWLSEV